jgi:hypothetical protein
MTHPNCKKKYTCDVCSEMYCKKCMNESCDWCAHHRLENTQCPNCDSTVNLSGQTVCIGCLYTDITEFYDVFFCVDCDEYLSDLDDDCKECQSKKHNVVKDKKQIIEYVMKKYPKAKEFFNLFYRNPFKF